MTSKTLYGELRTNKPFEEIRNAVKKSFQIVGGVIQDTPNGILILNGKLQVRYTFTAISFTATVDIRQAQEGKYDLVCTIKWQPNYFLHLIMFIWGFITLVTWLYNILYFFVNPTRIYQQAIDRVQFYLE